MPRHHRESDRLTPRQEQMLRLLAERPMNTREISRQGFGFDSASAYGVVTRLGMRGLVAVVGWSHREGRQYGLTARGRELERRAYDTERILEYLAEVEEVDPDPWRTADEIQKALDCAADPLTVADCQAAVDHLDRSGRVEVWLGIPGNRYAAFAPSTEGASES